METFNGRGGDGKGSRDPHASISLPKRLHFAQQQEKNSYNENKI